MKTFNLPDLGEGLPDAEIVRWLVKEGDQVKTDQPMVEMETAKAVVEVPSPFTGTISKLHGKEGDVIPVGAALVEFDGVVGGSSGEQPAQQAEAQPAAPAQNKAAQNQSGAASSNAQVFKLPDLGEGLPDAEIVRWLVKEGDQVKVDQPMVEMETAKAVVEVPAPFTGRIAKLHGKEGDVIPVGNDLVSFGDADAAVSQQAAQTEPPAEGKREDSGTVVGNVQVGNTVTAESANALVKALARKMKVDLSQVTGTGAGGAITQADVRTAAVAGNKGGAKAVSQPTASSGGSETETSNPLAYRASPAVRAMARREGVDLSQCQATGKKGSITREDVKRAASGAPGARSAAPAQAATSSASGGSRLPSVTVTVEPEPVRGVRRAMANAMSTSHAEVVPVTLMDDANISKWRKGTDATARLLRAISLAAKAEPGLNCWFDGKNMERLLHPEVHVGIAVDMPDGLYVPVVRNAERKDLAQLRNDLNNLIDKVKTKSIKQEDLSNPTITLSNFGTIAGRYGTPIVVPPQVAILGSGRYRDEVKLTDRGFEVQRHMPLSLSFDHRACTGGEGARFLATVIQDLEKPE